MDQIQKTSTPHSPPVSVCNIFVNMPHACYRRGPKQKFSQPAQTSSFMATLQAKRNVFDQRMQQGFDVNDPKALTNLKSSTLSALGRSPAASATHSPTARQPPLSKGGGGSAASAFASKNYSSSSEDDVAQPVPPPPLTTKQNFSITQLDAQIPRAAIANRAPAGLVKPPPQLMASRVRPVLSSSCHLSFHLEMHLHTSACRT